LFETGGKVLVEVKPHHGEERVHRREGHVDGVGPVAEGSFGSLAPVREERVPLDDVELDVEEAVLEDCCTYSFIGIGCIWPEPTAEVCTFTFRASMP
jgi:hypothetical protein